MNYLNIKFYTQTFFAFLQFLVFPKSALSKAEDTGNKIAASIFLLGVKFAFSLTVASLIGMFYEPKNLTDQAMAERFSPWAYLAVGGLILPFFEEVLFRLSLVFKPIYLSLSLGCGTYYILTKAVFGSKLSLVDDTFFIRVGAGLAVGLLLYFLLSLASVKIFLKRFWERRFSVVYYLSATVFAWLHVFNFEVSFINILLTPILTLPQLFSGLISGYLRVRFGFMYPLLLHVFTNSLLIGLSILIE